MRKKVERFKEEAEGFRVDPLFIMLKGVYSRCPLSDSANMVGHSRDCH